MTLAVVRQRLREGRRPPRDVVLAFLADEEAGGTVRRSLARRQPSRTLRGVHRGHRRGRRLQLLRERGPAAVSRRGRRKGHGVDAPHRSRASRARVDDQRRQRRRHARGGGRSAGPLRVADTADADRAGVPDRGDPTQPGSNSTSTRRPSCTTLSPSSADRPRRRRDPAQHRSPHDARRRLQGERHPAVATRASTADSCPATRRSSSTPSTRSSAPTSSESSNTPTSRSKPGSTGRCSTRCGPRYRRRTRARASCRTACPVAPTRSRSAAWASAASAFAPAPAAVTRLHRDVPWCRRAGSGRRAALRCPRPRPLPGRVLSRASLRRYARADDATPKPHRTAAVGVEAHPVELPGAVLGVIGQQLACRAASDAARDAQQLVLVLRHRPIVGGSGNVRACRSTTVTSRDSSANPPSATDVRAAADALKQAIDRAPAGGREPRR